jgi:hypothetical protein
MIKTKPAKEITPADDVRRVRERLSREAGNDIQEFAEESNRVARRYRRRLGLKSVRSDR